jgi:hypothetical protein
LQEDRLSLQDWHALAIILDLAARNFHISASLEWFKGLLKWPQADCGLAEQIDVARS